RGGALIVYDLTTGREVQRLSPGLGWFGIRFDPTGRRLALSGLTQPVQVWDLDTAKVLQKFPGLGPVYGIGVQPGGKPLAAGGHARIYLLEADTGRTRAVLGGFWNQAMRVAFGADDLLASDGWDGATHFWDASCGHHLMSVIGIQAIQFAPEGREFAYFSTEI